MKRLSTFFLKMLVVSAAVFFSCEKDPDPNYVKIVIPVDTNKIPNDTTMPIAKWLNYKMLQGEHNNEIEAIRFMNADTIYDSIVFQFSFDSTAIYRTADPKNQRDWNKLVGFSDCQTFHQTNSVRTVWRWDTLSLKMEIGEYFYKNSTRTFSKITEMEIGDTLTASVIRHPSDYEVIVNGISSVGSRACSNNAGSYWLFPYFGGDEPAPQDINLFIRYIYPELE